MQPPPVCQRQTPITKMLWAVTAPRQTGSAGRIGKCGYARTQRQPAQFAATGGETLIWPPSKETPLKPGGSPTGPPKPCTGRARAARRRRAQRCTPSQRLRPARAPPRGCGPHPSQPPGPTPRPQRPRAARAAQNSPPPKKQRPARGRSHNANTRGTKPHCNNWNARARGGARPSAARGRAAPQGKLPGPPVAVYLQSFPPS
jgi:hypothetical protein